MKQAQDYGRIIRLHGETRRFSSSLIKKKEPIAFLTLEKIWDRTVVIPTLYVKKKYRGLMGIKPGELGSKHPKYLKGKGYLKGTGQNLLEYGVEVARRMDYRGVEVSEMSPKMFGTSRRIRETDSLKRTVENHELLESDGHGEGRTWLLRFRRRKPK